MTIRAAFDSSEFKIFDEVEKVLDLVFELEYDQFLIVASAEGQECFQMMRENETQYRCEFNCGTKFSPKNAWYRADPELCELEDSLKALKAYCLEGCTGEMFQASLFWIENENFPPAESDEDSIGFNVMSPHASGVEFEKAVALALNSAGWETRLTRRTGDQGLDLQASDFDYKVAIQCKRYSSPVSNTAVQEIHAAADFVGATHAVVVTTSSFTRSAHQLAEALRVVLLHIDDLPDLRSHLVFIPPRQRIGPLNRLFIDT
jgi:hypothetical protein